MDASGEAFEVDRAYGAYRRELFVHLLRVTRDSEAAEDLLQEAYTRLLKEVRSGRAPLNTRAWLYRVADNLATSRGRRLKVVERHARHLPLPTTARSAEELCLSREAAHLVRTLLTGLDPIDRSCLLMAAEGYTSADIALTIGRSRSAVRTRMCRARGRLRALVPPGHGPAHAAS